MSRLPICWSRVVHNWWPWSLRRQLAQAIDTERELRGQLSQATGQGKALQTLLDQATDQGKDLQERLDQATAESKEQQKRLQRATDQGKELHERLDQATAESKEQQKRLQLANAESTILQDFLTQETKEKEKHAHSTRSLVAQRERLFQIMELAGKLSRFENGNHVDLVLNQVRHTEAQFYQDIIGLLLARGRKDGWFVEFGACDGIRISNTYILERHFGWQGIVAEPGRSWHSALRRNRRCHIDTRCVFSKSGLLIPFYEAAEGSLESSNIADHMGLDRLDNYEAETVSLLDMLIQHGAPAHIDFMSVDTEGTEYEILSAFPFDQYQFGLICVEHHLPEEEDQIKKLMRVCGYTQIYRSISGFDGWYVQKQVSEII